MSGDAGASFRVETVGYDAARDALHAVRDAVFVREQGVPVALEHDALDPACVHVLARTPSGDAIGTGRLVPPGEGLPARIGRMAVLPAWRGRGVGATLLQALLAEARGRGWERPMLHAQAPVIGFYRRLGFVEDGPRFMEAGIEHQGMRLAPAEGHEARSGTVHAP